MKVVVASRNPVKLGAAAEAFEVQFPEAEIEIVAVEVDSGAGDQPMTDAATRAGARTRAGNAAAAHPAADFWVGIEGGAETLDGQLIAFAWMVVRAADGRVGEARSPTLPLPPAVLRLVADGLELGEANDRVFATVNSKQGGGAFGLLTDGRLTRESIYAQTLSIALIPLIHPLYRQDDPT